MHRLARIVALVLPLGGLLGGCAETEFVLHTAKQFGPQSPQKAEGQYKIGKPYKIENIWYYPAVDY